jgi:quercetin dioxygenase-like cupin family protein
MKLKSIAWALQLILVLFVTAALANDNGVQVNVLAKSTESWNNNPLPQYPQGHPQVTILRILIPPGSILPLHTHPVINAGVLIKGELTVVTKAGQTLHLKAGDPIVEVVNTWHYGKNEGTKPADIIVFYAGIKDNPITVKE